MTSADFIKSAIRREDRLFLLIYKFNNAISEFIDWGHVADAKLSEIAQKIVRSKRGRRKLSQYLLKYFNLNKAYFYNFEDPRLRLVLLDAETIDKLLIYAGAALYSGMINKIIVKKKLLALKESIGDDIYFFVTKRASLLTTLAPKMSLNGGAEELVREDLFDAGKRCLEMCFANEPEAFIERLKLKFPTSVGWDFYSDIAAEQKTKAWNYLYRILAKEIKPKMIQCFT